MHSVAQQYRQIVTADRLQWGRNNINTQDRRRRRFQLTQTLPAFFTQSPVHTHTLHHAHKRRCPSKKRDGGEGTISRSLIPSLPVPRVLVEVVFAASSKGNRRLRVRDSLHFNSSSLTVCCRALFYSVARKTAGLCSLSVLVT